MVETGLPGSMVLMYGVAIGQALVRGKASPEDLVKLRDEAAALLESQGDLAAAIAALDAEIAQRGAAVAKREAPEPQSARFLVDIDVPVPEDRRIAIEKAIHQVVMHELAVLDTKGDLVSTPLSDIKSFGGTWPGGATMGMFISDRILRP